MSDELMLAWCAGFIDGEGTLDVARCQIQVQQNEVEPLVRLQALLRGHINGPYTRYRRREPGVLSNPYWVWRVGKRCDVVTAARLLAPLVIAKRVKMLELASLDI